MNESKKSNIDKSIRLRMSKIKRRALVFRGSECTRGLAFEYELSFDGDCYIVGVAMTKEKERSYKEMSLSSLSKKAALEFFGLCTRCAVTPLNLEYVYEDFALDFGASGRLSSTV